MTIEDDEILQSYVEESQEHLTDVENDLLVIEEAGADIDIDLVNKVFRTAHSLKGGAGFMGLNNIKELAHKMENVLGMVRSREMIPTPHVVNVLLSAFDKLKELVSHVDRSNEIDISEHIETLTRLTTEALPEEEKESLSKMVDICLPDGHTVFTVSEFDISQALKGGKFLYLVQYDLIHDVQNKGKTPLEVLTAMQKSGIIVESKVDIAAVGSLDDEAFSNRLPFLVLFATIIDPDVISALFEVDDKYIHRITPDVTLKQSVPATRKAEPEPEKVPAKPEAPEAGKEPEPKPEPEKEKPQEVDKAPGVAQADTTLRVHVSPP